MPKFPKSDGYKMKGFTYPGESPLKGADATLVQGARAMYTAGAARTGAFIKAALPGLMKGVEGALKGTVLAPEGVKEARKTKRTDKAEAKKEYKDTKVGLDPKDWFGMGERKTGDMTGAEWREKKRGIKEKKRKAVGEAWKESKRRSPEQISKTYEEYAAMKKDDDTPKYTHKQIMKFLKLK